MSTASFGELLDNPATRDVLERHLPGLGANPRFSTARRMTLRALMIFAPDELAEDAIRAVESDLSRLPRP